MLFTYFCAHVEGGYLGSVLYLEEGPAKVRYVCLSQHMNQFERDFYLGFWSIWNVSIPIMMKMHRDMYGRQLPSIIVLLWNQALHYHFTESSNRKEASSVSPRPYSVGLSPGYNMASPVIYEERSWCTFSRSVAKIPITSCMPDQAGIPLKFMLWPEFKKSLNLLKTQFIETIPLLDIHAIRATATTFFMNMNNM